MPTVGAGDLNVYYELFGEGAETVVLIAGLNCDHTLYRTIAPELAARYRVLLFDNRGVGRTDKPDFPYSIEMMADDTAALMDALGIGRAHVIGTSMGGRIAFSIALRHPERVRSLVLISTALEPTTTLRRRWLRLMLRFPFVRGPHPYYAVRRQIEATAAFNAMDRLAEIRVPTLILHGKRDGLASFSAAVRIHEGIQGSRLIGYDGGHLFFLFRTKQVVEAITGFFDGLAEPHRPLRSER